MNILDRLAIIALASVLSSACATAADPDDALADLESAASSPAELELWSSGSSWFFNVSSTNGEVLLSSEAYSSRTAALGGVLSVLDNGTLERRYVVAAGQDGDSYVRLRAGNGRTIATGEGYSTPSNARRAIRATAGALGSYVEAWSEATGARFVVFADADDRFRFNLYGKAGEIALSSNSYATEAAALNGAFATAERGVDPLAYRVVDTAGGFYLEVRAGNGAVVAASATFATRRAAEQARDALVALLPEIELL